MTATTTMVTRAYGNYLGHNDPEGVRTAIAGTQAFMLGIGLAKQRDVTWWLEIGNDPEAGAVDLYLRGSVDDLDAIQDAMRWDAWLYEDEENEEDA